MDKNPYQQIDDVPIQGCSRTPCAVRNMKRHVLGDRQHSGKRDLGRFQSLTDILDSWRAKGKPQKLIFHKLFNFPQERMCL